LKGEDPGEIATVIAPFFRPINRRFTQSIMSYDPLVELADVDVPVMIVQGATDFQIRVADSQLLAEAKPEARLVVIPEANHVFKHAPDAGRGSQTRAYIDPTLPIVSELVDAIAEWISEIHERPL
jgi:pimeloyl-ACP methyl ester carboxylesterase